MACIEESTIPQEIRRIINNGYHVPHPFKGAYLQDMMSIFMELRKLDRDRFGICAQAIQDRIQNESCVNCRGKGLAYLKLAALEVDRKIHERFSKLYAQHISLRENMRDFEAEIKSYLCSQR